MEVVKSKHQGRQYGTNFTLGDDNIPLVSSYYKDYIESNRRTTTSIVQPATLTRAPTCARILVSKEQYPTAHVATTTARRDYRDWMSSRAVYREGLQALSFNKTLHSKTSVVFGPAESAGEVRFLSSAQDHYRDPVDTVARDAIMKRGN